MYLKKQETGTPLTPRQHHAIETWLAAHVNPSIDLTDGTSRSYVVSEYQEQFNQVPLIENRAPLPDVSPIKFRDALRDGFYLVNESPDESIETGVTVTPEQYRGVMSLLENLGTKKQVLETHRVILELGGWITKTDIDFAELNQIAPGEMERGLREGWNIREVEASFPHPLNESFTDTWDNKITVFKAVTDNTVSVSITPDGADKAFSTGRLNNDQIDQLIDLLQRAKS